MESVREAGYAWEERVVGTLLQDRVLMAAGVAGAPIRSRCFSRDETLSILASAGDGSFIYQALIRPPPSFYKKFGLDSAAVKLSDNRPDLIAVTTVSGRRRFRVIDIKRSDTARAVHRIQILLYALQLETLLPESGIDATVDVETGGVWLGGAAEPIALPLGPVRAHVERFLREDLSRICATAAVSPSWHVHFRCEWCDYFDHCKSEARSSDNVSRIAGLTTFGKKFLAREGVATVAELDVWLGAADSDEKLTRCASLAGRGHLLRGQVASFLSDSAILHGASSAALPIGENVAVFLTAQEEPLAGACYLAGALVSVRDELRAPLGLAAPLKPLVWAAADAATVNTVAEGFIEYLDGLFQNVTDYNAAKTWGSQLSLQCYVHNQRERAVLGRLLVGALEVAALREAAMRLLLHFSGPDLANADEHPELPIAYPLVVLLDAQTRLVAVPVDTSYTLPESLFGLGSSHTYLRDPTVHFPLGHGMRPDGIHRAWKGESSLDSVRKWAAALLKASQALLRSIRETAGKQLATWPPKFEMPGNSGIKSPMLARLAFFSRFESVIRCAEVRAERSEAPAVQRQLGTALELEATGSDTFRVIHGPPTIGVSEMPESLLIPDDPHGRLAQLQFPDYEARNRPFFGKAAMHRAIVGVKAVATDDIGAPVQITLKWGQKFATGAAEIGRRYLLLPRFLDFNTEKVIRRLRTIDQSGDTSFATLLQSPDSLFAGLPGPVEKSAISKAPSLGLTPSQSRAYECVRRQTNSVVWGPPGTGKSHFIGSILAGLASAHADTDHTFRVLVTAFTHAAIENVLKKTAATIAKHFPGQALPVWKAGKWRGENQPGGVTCVSEEFEQFGPSLLAEKVVIVGATVYACFKADPGAVFDLVVIDEASQVRLPEASIPISLRNPSGRLLVAGDHQQLPPIVNGEWPDSTAPPVVHGSILTALRRPDNPALGLQLNENWRMNQTLTEVASRFIYGGDYKCATSGIASQLLRWVAPTETGEFAKYSLEPEYPLVLVVLDGVEAGKENVREAELVALLSRSLRDGLSTEGGLYPNDAAFFESGLFIVSPHHVQIAAIRKTLATRGLTHTCVDTVEKMQGQEAEAVLVSYGVSDPEFAMREAAFIYSRNRLNVAITRARSKAVLFIPRPLLDAPPGVLDVEDAVEGLAFMRQLYDLALTKGQSRVFPWQDGVSAQVLRYRS